MRSPGNATAPCFSPSGLSPSTPPGRLERHAFRHSKRLAGNSEQPFLLLFYCLNLALGLVGFLAVDSFKTSRGQGKKRIQVLLGADLAVRARRELTPDELDKFKGCLPPGTETTEVVDFYSMAAGPGNRSRLVRIIAFEKAFPFYGDFDLKMEGKVEGDAKENKLIHSRKLAWIYPELQGQLGLGLGEEIKVGRPAFGFRTSSCVTAGFSSSPRNWLPRFISARLFLPRPTCSDKATWPFTTISCGSPREPTKGKSRQSSSRP